ncbi:Ubiquitin system component Cue [Macleaya cordata]|uniref:Ubiquitin system component Cue n=1 Tax=Macleaya cordata TaxID=56857 RepID=A0A200PZ73_MACCD|nr:Ubiquitin system component Cue [Macleaya cordata]
MSAGVCGKRLGFEEIFGSSAPSSSAKRSRCSSFGSPIRSSDFGFGSEDKVSILLRMFPAMDRELVESVLNTHNHKIEDAIESLHALCLGDVSAKAELQSPDSMMMANSPAAPESIHVSEQKIEDLQDKDSTPESTNPMDGSSWVDIFVQEMMNASDLDDARGRASRILEAFEKSVLAHSRASEEEIASLREHLQSMLRDNQILKRAVAIQHERTLEQEGKAREVEQLKHAITQYQEQLKTLEFRCCSSQTCLIGVMETQLTFFSYRRNFQYGKPYWMGKWDRIGTSICLSKIGFDVKLRSVMDMDLTNSLLFFMQLNNYTLKLHLQRAQESSSMPGHFHPDVF